MRRPGRLSRIYEQLASGTIAERRSALRERQPLLSGNHKLRGSGPITEFSSDTKWRNRGTRVPSADNENSAAPGRCQRVSIGGHWGIKEYYYILPSTLGTKTIAHIQYNVAMDGLSWVRVFFAMFRKVKSQRALQNSRWATWLPDLCARCPCVPL